MTRPKKAEHQKTNSPFKRLRLNVKLSQEQLAREIGVAVSTIRRWEKGQAEPTMTVAQMKEFCRAVKKNFEELPNSLLPPNGSNSVSNGTS
ncbi:helix-turn-helix transcriptional regulator [Waterburya agarophytonicola K14]|uniref:Helix-turn-helix transcriptional regulator n=1 Tax=Waterburya agarophytonicola KI4 TaxID=2874699 RepID=A0A964BRI9_9CYAN|nr:helix-turn-helix transcriptional regulator [Waterburya agarophytonicola]MCC0177909.1 helix-turn-helix transcriptional regulator [Waterburya agarophytonicola KI4]